jgi:hypothetical protein
MVKAMREDTKVTKVYEFKELSEEVREKAIDKLWDINVEYSEWWDGVYDDAENIGLKIESFDLDYHSISGKFMASADDTYKSIMIYHGKDCETYITAQIYREELAKEVELNFIRNREEDCPEDFLDTEEVDKEFLHMLLQDYLIILKKEYEYRTSEEAIKETIEANEYEFTEDGELY